MAITNRDQLVAAVASAVDTPFHKIAVTTASGLITALFRAAAGSPAASTTAVPTSSGRTLDRTDPGAIPIPSAGASTLYQVAVDLVSTVTGTIILADRLVEYGGLSGIVTTAQTLTSINVPSRAGNGVGCELWLEWYVATGSTAVPSAITASYTNSDGVAGRTATLYTGIPASVPAYRSYRMALQAGDVGVKSVQSVTVPSTTGTAGSFGVTIRKPLAFWPLNVASVGMKWGYAETALSVIPTDACLELLILATGTSSGLLQGILAVGQG